VAADDHQRADNRDELQEPLVVRVPESKLSTARVLSTVAPIVMIHVSRQHGPIR
jgi:hypothetical protein